MTPLSFTPNTWFATAITLVLDVIGHWKDPMRSELNNICMYGCWHVIMRRLYCKKYNWSEIEIISGTSCSKRQEGFINRIAYTSLKAIDFHHTWHINNTLIFVFMHAVCIQSHTMYYDLQYFVNTFSCIALAKVSTFCFTWFNNVIYCGSKIFFDIVCHSKQQCCMKFDWTTLSLDSNL